MEGDAGLADLRNVTKPTVHALREVMTRPLERQYVSREPRREKRRMHGHQTTAALVLQASPLMRSDVQAEDTFNLTDILPA
jgi:hypothetical protein